jgi:hypothetical protein
VVSATAKVLRERDFPQIREKKVELAELLPTNVKEQPPTYVALAERLSTTRSKHPVKHPDDVVLPKVRGLTA